MRFQVQDTSSQDLSLKTIPKITHILDKYLLLTITDLEGTIQYASQGICSLFGYSINDLVGKNHKIFKHNSSQKHQIQNLWETIENNISWKGELENKTKDNRSIWVDIVIEPLFNTEGKKFGYLSIRHNVTDKKRNESLSKTDPLTKLYNRRYFDLILEQKLEKARFLNATITLAVLDVDHFKQFNDYYGHPKGDSVLQTISKTIQSVAKNYQAYAFRLGGEEFGILLLHADMQLLKKMLDEIHCEIKNLEIEHKKSTVGPYLTVSIGALLTDMHHKESIEHCSKKLYSKADALLYKSKREGRNKSSVEQIRVSKATQNCKIDEITKLPSRDTLDEVLKDTKNKKMLIIIHINHYEYVLNQYGQEGLNTILINKSKIYKNIFEPKQRAYLFRLNINEFAILVEDEKLFESYILKTKHYILNQTFSHVNNQSEEKIVVSQIAGVAIGNDKLLSKADLALKEANSHNLNFCIYNKSMENDYKNAKIYLKEISLYRSALENDRIIPYFQPIVCANSGKIFKYEALARVLTEDNTILLPHKFLKIAQEDRTFNYFTKQLLQKIFRVYENNNQIGITINLSYSSIASKEILFYLQNRLERYGGENLVFEILETKEYLDDNHLYDFIKLIRHYGASIAIDDFGVGYSNISHIAKFSPDFVKIDGSLMQSINTDKKIENLLNSLLLYSNKAGKKLIAEHVSSQQIAQKATQMGIDYLQGFYLGKPRLAQDYGLKGF